MPSQNQNQSQTRSQSGPSYKVIFASIAVLALIVAGLVVAANWESITRPDPETLVREHIRAHSDYEEVDTLQREPDSLSGEAIFRGKSRSGRKVWEFRVSPDGTVTGER